MMNKMATFIQGGPYHHWDILLSFFVFKKAIFVYS